MCDKIECINNVCICGVKVLAVAAVAAGWRCGLGHVHPVRRQRYYHTPRLATRAEVQEQQALQQPFVPVCARSALPPLLCSPRLGSSRVWGSRAAVITFAILGEGMAHSAQAVSFAGAPRKWGRLAEFAPLLLTLEVTERKKAFITLTHEYYGETRKVVSRECVCVSVCVCVCVNYPDTIIVPE